MKRYIFITGMLGQILVTGEVMAQDTTRTTTTTTTTITTDSSSYIGQPQTPPPSAPAPAPAEEPEKVAKVYIGGRYMPTFSKFDIKTYDNGTAKTTMVLGHGGGGYIGTNFGPHAGLQLEVIYNELTQKYTYEDQESSVDLSYINVPLMLVLNTNSAKPVNFNITAGPQIAFNVGAKGDSYSSNGNDSLTAVVAVKPVDLGVAYGAGFDFKLGEAVTLDLGFRGVHGLIDISDNSKTKATNEYLILDRTQIDTYAGYIGLRINFY
jgi:opacity protein-like surface antigen